MSAKIIVIEMSPETQKDGSVLWCSGEILEVDASELEGEDAIDVFEILSGGFEEGDCRDDIVLDDEPILELVFTEPEEIDRRWSAFVNGALLPFIVLDDPSDLVEPGAITAELN